MNKRNFAKLVLDNVATIEFFNSGAANYVDSVRDFIDGNDNSPDVPDADDELDRADNAAISLAIICLDYISDDDDDYTDMGDVIRAKNIYHALVEGGLRSEIHKLKRPELYR